MLIFKINKLQKEKDELNQDYLACCEQREQWKANHDNQVKINQLLRDRPDLKERAGLVDRLIKERDSLLSELNLLRGRKECGEFIS